MESCPELKIYADQLVTIARWAYRNGWAPGTSTNYSVRLPDSAAPAQCAITGSSLDKETIEADQIIAVDQHGQLMNHHGLKPSTETLLHLMLYRAVGAGAVFHTHSMAATVLSRLGSKEGHVKLSGWELLKGLHGIDTHACEVVLPVFPNSQNMQELATHIELQLPHQHPCYGFLLAGHGLYVWGKDVRDAKRHLEVFEFLLQCEREVRSYGYPSSAQHERPFDG